MMTDDSITTGVDPVCIRCGCVIPPSLLRHWIMSDGPYHGECAEAEMDERHEDDDIEEMEERDAEDEVDV
jgi:hypothetical protein